MPRPAEELLYDSEAALRLVDTALHELNGAVLETAGGMPDPDSEPAPRETDGERGSPGEDDGES